MELNVKEKKISNEIKNKKSITNLIEKMHLHFKHNFIYFSKSILCSLFETSLFYVLKRTNCIII